MTEVAVQDLEKQIALLQRKADRDIRSRKQAEKILEQKSLELYELNLHLKKINEELDEKVLQRTEALQETISRLELVLMAANTELWEKNLTSGEFFCSEGLTELLGYDRHELALIFDQFPFVHDDDVGSLQQALEAHLRNEDDVDMECRLILNNGDERWFRLNIQALWDEEGRVARIAGSFVDVHDQVESRRTIEYMALYDNLTKIPNRAQFSEKLKLACYQAKAQQQGLALLVIDLNDFKEINDRYGHQAGDELLRHVAAQITGVIKGNDTIARLGGDEFAVILQRMDTEASVSKLCQEMIEQCEKPIILAHSIIKASLCIGAAFYADAHSSPKELIAHADIAMYQAKESKHQGSTLCFFREEMKQQVRRARLLKTRIDEALHDNEFMLYYQPKQDLKTQQINGVEALIRWPQSDGSLLMPEQFIPLSEETRQIKQIGRWVIRHCCIQARNWQDRGIHLPIAMNLSPVQFSDDDLAGYFQQMMQQTGTSGEQFQVEITEGLILNELEASRKQLERLHALGITVCLDDFGTGYSNLRYLHQLPINILKIDRVFVSDVDRQVESQHLTRAIIGLSHSLGMRVVAEGVEREGEKRWLEQQGCDMIQGFLCSEPLPASAVEEMLPVATEVP